MFFVLRKLSAAVESRNPILGIVRALVTGHNGPTRALATPSVEAQEALYRKLLDSAGLAASNVSLLEGEYATPSFHSPLLLNLLLPAHGTGTRLGDAIEAEAIRKVYEGASRKNPLWLSSSKTVFGHCQAASAFVGMFNGESFNDGSDK